MAVNWFELALGGYLVSPVSPDDAVTMGATTVPGVIAGGVLILDGLLNEGRFLDSIM